MRRSPLDLTATVPQPHPARNGEESYAPVSQRALVAAQYIATHLELPRLARVSLEIEELPLVHERARAYVPFLSDNPDDAPLLRQPHLGEAHHYPKRPAVRIGLRGSTHGVAHTPHNFHVVYEAFRLQAGQVIVKCSPSNPSTPTSESGYVAREQAIYELFPGQNLRKIDHLASINVAYIDGNKQVYALHTFNTQAFGCDILRLIGYGIRTANGEPLSIEVASTGITEHSPPSEAAPYVK